MTTLDGIVALRTLDDSLELRDRLHRATSILVVGAGLLGLEVAAAARKLGKNVVVIEQGPMPLKRVFHPKLAHLVLELHRRHGVQVVTSATIERFEGEEHVVGAQLRDGSFIPADLVIVAIGTTPNVAWLRGSGITIADGVIVNELGMTRVPDIYAAGDVARVYSRALADHVRFEQAGHASEQGSAVGRIMAGDNTVFTGMPSASTIVFGVRAQSFGQIRQDLELVIRGDAERSLGFLLDDGAIAGCFAFNRARDFAAARQLVLARTPVPRRALADESGPLVELSG